MQELVAPGGTVEIAPPVFKSKLADVIMVCCPTTNPGKSYGVPKLGVEPVVPVQ